MDVRTLLSTDRNLKLLLSANIILVILIHCLVVQGTIGLTLSYVVLSNSYYISFMFYILHTLINVSLIYFIFSLLVKLYLKIKNWLSRFLLTFIITALTVFLFSFIYHFINFFSVTDPFNEILGTSLMGSIIGILILSWIWIPASILNHVVLLKLLPKEVS